MMKGKWKKQALFCRRFIGVLVMILTLLAGTSVYAETSAPMRGTDKTAPGSGNVFMVAEGTYSSATKEAILNRVNEIRLEACKEGLIDPTTKRKFSESDYVPMKWSADLEWIAQLRAAEACVMQGHERPNGGSTVSYNGKKSYGENLAWNWTGMMQGIEQWYDEKADYVGHTGKVTGHYESLIASGHKYIGLGTFRLSRGGWYAVAAEFSNGTWQQLTDETKSSLSGLYSQIIEVAGAKVTSMNISGTQELEIDGESALSLFGAANMENAWGELYSYESEIVSGATWTSSDQSVATVDSTGKVKAVKVGKTTITATVGSVTASYEIEVVPISISAAAVTLEENVYEYTEAPINAPVKAVTLNGKVLEKDKDYTVSYADNINKGDNTAKVIVTGKGNYKDSVSVNFTIADCKHIWDDGTVTKKPTCIAEGEKTFTCTKCKETKKEAVEKAPHTVVTDPAVAATCTAKGKTEGSHCSVCKAVIVPQQETEMVPHTYSAWVVTKEPTCTETGSQTRTCTVCHTDQTEDIAAKGHTEVIDPAVEATCIAKGKTEGSHCSVCNVIIKEQKEIEKTAHTYGEWQVTKEATCTESGSRERYCSVCNDKNTETLQAKGHTEVKDAAIAATCTKTGKTEGSHCSVCGVVLKAQQETPMIAHKYGQWEITKEPTWDEAGEKKRTCSMCDKAEVEPISALSTGHEHDFSGEEIIQKDADCTNKGSKIIHCTAYPDCKETKTVEIPAKGHKFGDWEVVKNATCTEDGKKTSTCSVCGAVKEEIISATGHTEVIDAAVEATCTEAGKTEGSHCSVCNTVIREQETVPAKGHTEVTDAAVEATCTEEGKTEGSHCSVCNAVIRAQETVPAKGHTEVTDAAVEATCTEEGKTEGSHCSVCDEVIKPQEIIPAKGHTEVIDTAAVEATCTEEGRTEGSHCSVCNAVIKVQATIPAKGHSYSDWKVTKEATWNEDGEQERSCLVCGLTEKQPISKLSADHVHDFSGNEVVIKPATTTETGIKEIHCADEKCDAVSQVEIPKLVNQTTSTQEEQTVSTNNGNANTGSTNNAGKNNVNKNNTNKNNASAAQINKSGVNTGDNTQIVLFVALMLISFVCLGVIMYKGVLRQRRK